MSEAADKAYEVEHGLLVEDPVTLARAGFFVGGVLPHIKIPDADVGTMYIRRISAVEAVRYKALKDNPALAEDWEELDTGGGGSSNTGCVPFWDTAGVTDFIALVTGALPFWDAAGVSNPIVIVSCP